MPPKLPDELHGKLNANLNAWIHLYVGKAPIRWLFCWSMRGAVFAGHAEGIGLGGQSGHVYGTLHAFKLASGSFGFLRALWKVVCACGSHC